MEPFRRALAMVLLSLLVCCLAEAEESVGRDAGPLLLRGTVTLEDGTPAEGGGVSLGDRAAISPIRGGKFELAIEAVAPGEYPVTYHTERGDLVVMRPIRIAPGQRVADVALRAGEEPAVRGRVVTDDMPNGVPNARVTLRRDIGGSLRKSEVRAGDGGRFVLDGYDFAGWTIEARVRYHRATVPVEIKPPFPAHIELCPAPETLIIGRIATEGGGWIDGPGTVGFIGAGHIGWARTDERGQFEVEGLQPGQYRIAAYAPYRLPANLLFDLSEGQQAIAFSILLRHAPVTTARGRVVGPEGTTGVARAEVSFIQYYRYPSLSGDTVRAVRGFMPEEKYSVVTGQDGSFEVDLPVIPTAIGGSYRWQVEVRPEGYLPRRYVAYVDPTMATKLVLQVFRGGRLKGRLRRADNELIPQGVQVELQVAHGLAGRSGDPEGSSSWGAPIGAGTGRFDFGLVQPGRHWLSVRVPDAAEPVRKLVTVVEGETREVDIQVPMGGR